MTLNDWRRVSTPKLDKALMRMHYLACTNTGSQRKNVTDVLSSKSVDDLVE